MFGDGSEIEIERDLCPQELDAEEVLDFVRPDRVEKPVAEKKNSDLLLLLMMMTKRRKKRLRDLWVSFSRFLLLLHPSARSDREQRKEGEAFEDSFRAD